MKIFFEKVRNTVLSYPIRIEGGVFTLHHILFWGEGGHIGQLLLQKLGRNADKRISQSSKIAISTQKIGFKVLVKSTPQPPQ